MQIIVAAGTTFSWDREIAEDAARAAWMNAPPRRTLVAVDDVGAVIGTAEMGPNHGGPGSHVATAGFMVDPAFAGRGAGRARARTGAGGGIPGDQFNAVVETNDRAVRLWRSLGFRVLTTVPEGFRHPEHGYVGLHIMYRTL